MSVTQNMNQFAMTPLKGNVAAIVNPTTISCQIDPNSSSTIVAGDAVKLTATTGQTILVDVAGATQAVFGYVLYTAKKDKWVAGDPLEVGLPDTVLYLESGAAIARGKVVEWAPSTHQVIAWAGSNPTSGLALDNATASGQLIRVQVREAERTEISSSSSCRSSSSSCRSSSSSSSSSQSV